MILPRHMLVIAFVAIAATAAHGGFQECEPYRETCTLSRDGMVETCKFDPPMNTGCREVAGPPYPPQPCQTDRDCPSSALCFHLVGRCVQPFPRLAP